MATYIQGVTDYIPEIQPFKPDLKFYSEALSIKQSRYDAALKQFNNLYGSILYAPLSAKDNIKRRDDYFKMIEQDLKKVTSMDLSLPENQSTAMSIFEPLVTDKYIAHDMAFTRYITDQMQRGDNMKYTSTFAAPGSEKKNYEFYNDISIQQLNGFLSDYDKASPGERLTMSPVDYFPKIDLYNLAMDFVKQHDLIYETMSSDGRYLITRKNGIQQKVPMQNVFTAMYGSDYKVRGMMNAQAYVSRKSYVNENLEKFNGDENAAEDDWYRQVMQGTGEKLIERAKMAEGPTEYAKWKRKALEDKIRKDGIASDTADENPTLQDWISSVEDEELGKITNQYYKGILSELESMGVDPSNRALMRRKIDNIVTAGLLEENMDQISSRIAELNTGITKIEAEPYEMERVKFGYDLAKIKYTKDLEYDNSLKLKIFDLTSELAGIFSLMGFGIGSNGKAVNADPDQTGGPGANMLLAYQQQLLKAAQMLPGYEKQGVTMMLNYAEGLINSNDPNQVKLGKSVKKEIFGAVYDENKNVFTKNGKTVKNWSELGIDDNEYYDYFRRAENAFRGQYGLMDQSMRQDFTKLVRDHKYYWATKNAMAEPLKNNATLIYNNIPYILPDFLPKEEQGNFKLLFKQLPDGRFYIKGQEEYMADITPYLKGTPKERQKTAAKIFENQIGYYSKIYNNPAEKSGISTGKFQSPDGMFDQNGVGETGKVVGQKIMFESDSNMPAMPGTVNMTDLANDIYSYSFTGGSAKNYLKVLSGKPGDNYYTGPEYDETPNDPNAEALALQFLKDNTQYYGSEDKKYRPRSTYFIKQGSGNNPNLESYHIMPSADWLASYKDGKGLVFGQTPQFWMSNGFHIFRDKSKSNTAATKQYSQSPFSAIMRSGTPVVIDVPDAGSTVFRSFNDADGNPKIKATVTRQSGYRDSDGVYRQYPNVTETFVYDDGIFFDPGKLYISESEALNQLGILNSGIKYNTFNPNVMIRDVNGLLSPSQAELDYGIRQPTGMENIRSTIQQRMQMVQQIYQMIKSGGL